MSTSKHISSVAGILGKSERILLLAPPKCALDTAAALLALGRSLQKQEKEITMVLPEGIPHQLQFMTGKDIVRADIPGAESVCLKLDTKKSPLKKAIEYEETDEEVRIIFSPQKGILSLADFQLEMNDRPYDVILTFDLVRLEDMGDIFEQHVALLTRCPIITFSTKADHLGYGKINLVDYGRAATCELVLSLLKEMNREGQNLINEDIASLLLAGIIARTGSFLEPGTTASALESASYLQSRGANHSDIIEHLFKMKSLVTLKLWGRILHNLEMLPLSHVVWSTVSHTDMGAVDAKGEDIDDIADMLLRFIKGSDFVALFIEEEGSVRVQLRSSLPGIDWESFDFPGELIPLEHGADLILEHENFYGATNEILELILIEQRQKYHLTKEEATRRLKLEPSIQEAIPSTETETAQTKKKASATPTAPQEVPFELSFDASHKKEKPAEKKRSTPGMVEKVEEEIVPEPGIPLWLTKRRAKK